MTTLEDRLASLIALLGSDYKDLAALGGGSGSGVMIVDNGDGTTTITAGGAMSITDNGDGTADITLDGDTVTIGSTLDPFLLMGA